MLICSLSAPQSIQVKSRPTQSLRPAVCRVTLGTIVQEATGAGCMQWLTTYQPQSDISHELHWLHTIAAWRHTLWLHLPYLHYAIPHFLHSFLCGVCSSCGEDFKRVHSRPLMSNLVFIILKISLHLLSRLLADRYCIGFRLLPRSMSTITKNAQRQLHSIPYVPSKWSRLFQSMSSS